MRRIAIDITDFYNEILIFIIWYSAWNILDVIFRTKPYDNNTILVVIILFVALALLILRATLLNGIV